MVGSNRSTLALPASFLSPSGRSGSLFTASPAPGRRREPLRISLFPPIPTSLPSSSFSLADLPFRFRLPSVGFCSSFLNSLEKESRESMLVQGQRRW